MRSSAGSTRRCGATPRSCSSSPASGRRSTRRSRARLRDWGHEDFTSYVVWACQRALERGLLPAHEPRRALARGPGAAARGDRLAGPDARVDRTPDLVGPRRARRPSTRRRRLETIRLAGELRIPFTSGILVGIGETEEERIASLEALAAVHAEYGHIQEVILQNFVPHPRYYGAEVAEIADEASQASAGRAAGPRAALGCRSAAACPDWADAGLGRRDEAADRRVASG